MCGCSGRNVGLRWSQMGFLNCAEERKCAVVRVKKMIIVRGRLEGDKQQRMR